MVNPDTQYSILDEGRYVQPELESLQNLSATLFRLENSRTTADIKQVLEA